MVKTLGIIYIINYATRPNILSNLGFEIKFGVLELYYYGGQSG